MKEVEALVAKYPQPRIQALLRKYLEDTAAARLWCEVCSELGWEPLVDHITIRTLDVDRRAQEFLKLGYEYRGEKIEYPNEGWWAKIYRPGPKLAGAAKNFPALFVDQAYADERGKNQIIPKWVAAFGDNLLHHAAMRVADIEKAVEAMKRRGVEFAGEIVGRPGSRLRQIFTKAETRREMAYTLLELTERNNYDGFEPEQADSLMKSSVYRM